MGLTLAVDFGSTFTKVAAFDLNNEVLVGVTKAASTVESDITIGLNKALEKLQKSIGLPSFEVERTLCCSSAAGGLRMAVAGLVNELTTKAAKEAALGAGAKVVGTYSFGLSCDDVKDIERISPDLILLTGGTDGGNKQVLVNNATILAASQLNAPVIIAGNKMAAGEAQSILEAAGKYAVRVENVLPELDRLNIEPTRQAIRDIFIKRITRAKGLEKAQALVGHEIIPTPLSVLKGAVLLAVGAGEEKGMGELIVVDVGGATTDVFSIAHGEPTCADYILKGLPEPFEKRTVEGDLGIRYNASSIWELAGSKKIIDKIKLIGKTVPQQGQVEKAIKHLSKHVDFTPQNEDDFMLDTALAATAVDFATRRHAGRIEEVYFPSGKARLQYGKDLTRVKCVVGTGGIFAYGREPRWILQSACFDEKAPESLRPVTPYFFIDECYILYAVGLLAEIAPLKALKIVKKHLREV